MIFRRQKSVNPFSSIAAGDDLYRFNPYRMPHSGTTRAANLDTFYPEPVQNCPKSTYTLYMEADMKVRNREPATVGQNPPNYS